MKSKRLFKSLVSLMFALSIMCAAGKGLAGIPEPDVIFYGVATKRGFEPVTDQISLILKKNAELIASYIPGTIDVYGGNYVLKIAMDALNSNEGKEVSFYIAEDLAGKAVIPAKGSIIELNLDTLYAKDSDKDLMDDSWELLYFGNLAREGSGDFNANGISDLAEYRAGNDPTATFWLEIDETHRETCVFNSVMLQKALDDAADDLCHNLIKVKTGIYPGNFTYQSALGEDFNLKIIGGYGTDCTERDSNPDLTILDGDTDGDGAGDGTVFSFDTSTNQTAGEVHIEGLYLRKGTTVNDFGGGININCDQADVKITGNKVSHCYTDNGGGVSVYTNTGSVMILNNTLVHNAGNKHGGGLFIRAGGETGLITIINNTIHDNYSPDGSGIYCDSAYTSPKIINNIITNNSGGKGISIEGGAIPDINYNNVWKNAAGNYNNPDFKGEHDLAVNPNFFDPVNDDFGLQPHSLCIDAGINDPVLPDFDQTGKIRIMDGDGDNILQVDMGALEVMNATPVDCDPKIDSDCDGILNDQDLCQGLDDMIDRDIDGIPDCTDEFIDSDHDGIADDEDKCPEYDDTVDTDGDSVPDGCDQCPGYDDNTDADSDGIPDDCDPLTDSDLDGVSDDEDKCPGYDDAIDSDNDGIPDGCDLCMGYNDTIDTDGDSVPDGCDQCPGYDDNTDADSDGIPDDCDPLITSANNPPAKPLLDSPVDGYTVKSLTPGLLTGAFFDPDNDDTHAMTEWQISAKSGDFSSASLVFSIKSDFCLTSLSVLDFILNKGKTYYWRVRFYDNLNTPSEWSDIGWFKTDPALSDALNNNYIVSDNVDVDFDGYSDNTQPDEIKTVTTLLGDAQIGIRIPENCTIISIKPIDPNDIYFTHNRPSEMPMGLIGFKLLLPNPGDEVTVNVYYSKPAPKDSRWYKYNQIKGWHDYSENVVFTSEKSAAITLKDGGKGDSDGVANGFIVDPSGLGILSSSASSGGGGNAVGCFIDKLN